MNKTVIVLITIYQSKIFKWKNYNLYLRNTRMLAPDGYRKGKAKGAIHKRRHRFYWIF